MAYDFGKSLSTIQPISNVNILYQTAYHVTPQSIQTVNLTCP